MRNLRQLLSGKPWFDSKSRSDRRRRIGKHGVRLSRSLRTETLEKRQLLAGDITSAHNASMPGDVNDDTRISPLDALMVINHLSRSASVASGEAPFAGYVDVNGDKQVSALDALLVINMLNAEGESDTLTELQVSPRLGGNQPLLDNGSATVGVGQIFELEVAYEDLRTETFRLTEDGDKIPREDENGDPIVDDEGNPLFEMRPIRVDELGAFQVRVDIPIGPDDGSLADSVMPLVTNAHQFLIDAEVRDASFPLQFRRSLPGGSTESTNVLPDQFASDPVGSVESALIDLGFSADTFVVTQFDAPDPDDFLIQARFDSLGVDPIEIFSLEADAQVITYGPKPSRLVSNEVSNSLQFVMNAEVRNLGGDTVFDQVPTGWFDPTFGFDEVGSLGPTSGPSFSVREPFVAFSIPVFITRPVSDLEIKIKPADFPGSGSDGNESVLLYNLDERVTLDQIRVDEDGSFLITALGDSENTPPVAVDDTATTPEETPIDIDVLANDSDDDGDPLTVALGSVAPTRGTVSVNQDGTILYTPNEGEIGTDTFSYVVNDGQVDSGEATVTVTITEVNDPPVLDGEVTATFSEDDPGVTTDDLTVDLLFGATDPDDDALSVVDPTLVSGDAAGITVDLANNQLEIDPSAYNSLAEGEVEVIVYSYGITDGQGNTVSQTATVTVNGVNDAPIANPDEADADGMNPLLIDVLANDNDPDGDELTLALGAGPQNGSVQIVDGQIEYTAGENAEFVDTFTYTISDGIADPVEATVTVNVFEENLPPTVDGEVTATFSEDDDPDEPFIDLLFGATDPNQDALSVVSLSRVSGDPAGITEDLANNRLEIDPSAYNSLAEGQNEAVVYSYVITDGRGGTVSQTATITILGVNDPPVAMPDDASTIGTAPVLIDVLANDFDPDDGDELTILLDPADPSVTERDTDFGSIRLVTDNGVSRIEYTANDNVALTDTFPYWISDGIADPVDTTVTVSVFEENLPPTVDGEVTATFTEDDDPDEPFIDLLFGATDPNQDSLSVVSLSRVSGDPAGITEDLANNRLEIDPSAYNSLAEGDSEVIVYSYGITDSEFTVSQTATITILGVNDPPVAIPDDASTIGTAPVLIDVLANDFDPDDGDELTILLDPADPSVAERDTDFGSIRLVTDNGVSRIEYTANDNVALADTFPYWISDGIADPVDTTVTVSVFEENLPPTVDGEVTATFTEDDDPDEPFIDLLFGATDPNQDSLSVVSLSRVSGDPAGITEDLANNRLEIDPSAYNSLAEGDSEVIVYSYGITDSEFTVSQTATITIIGVNDPPVAAEIDASTLKNGSVTIDVLAEATDPDLIDVLSVVEATDGSDGAVTLNADGTLTYTPATDFTGADSFTYTITDGIATSQATVTVTVNDFAPSMISGTIFFDHLENLEEVLNGGSPDRNGVKDDDESGLGGTPVLLVSGAGENVSGEEIRRVVYTGLHGDYEFDNVVPGTYRVVFEIPETIKFHLNSDGSSGNDGVSVLDRVIGPQGGEEFGDLNFTLINTIGEATESTHILTRPNPVDNQDRKVGLVRLSESGEQEYFRAFRGFENFQFAELTLNDSSDEALLSVIDDNGMLLTARISDDRFAVNEDGTTVQFYGSGDDFDFTPADSSSHAAEFSNYLNAIDNWFGSNGLDD